jgi:shikimate kinase
MGKLYLVGFMGCGKTTVGALLAERLERPFLDMDALLEKRLGCTIAAFFDRHGEAAFRAAETVLLREIAAMPEAAIVATGGGCFCSEENREIIRESGGESVYLHLPWSAIARRLVGETGGRPLFRSADEARLLLQRREPLYRQASSTLELEGPEDSFEVVELVLRALSEVRCAT